MRPRPKVSGAVLSQLLLKLYEAPLAPDQWPVFLTAFARALGLPALAIHDHDMRQGAYQFNLSTGIDASALTDYEMHFGDVDPYRKIFEAQHAEFSFGEVLCPTQELLKTEFYADFLVKHSMRLGVHAAASTIQKSDRLQVITAYRRLTDEQPDADVAEIFKIIIPHVRSALALQHRFAELTDRRSSLEAAIDAQQVAILLIDEHCKVIYASQSTQLLISEGRGISIRRGQLMAEKRAENSALTKLIAQIVSTSRTGEGAPLPPVTVTSRSTCSLRVSAVPISRTAPPLSISAPRRSAAVVFIRDENREMQFSASLVQGLYGLTRAEALLAMRLFEGQSLKEAAEVNGVKIETVRTQLKSVFQKTGVNRQSLLVQLLGRLTTSL